MRVLLYSHYFAPGSGGLTTFADGLAGNLDSLGVAVRLATATADNSSVQRPWPIHWAITSRQLIRLCRWADVVHMNGFRAAIVVAAWLTRRPLIWTHHEYSFCPTGLGWWRDQDRSFALPQCWRCLRDRGFEKRSAIRRIAATLARIVSSRLVSAHTTTTDYMKHRLKLAAATVIPLGVTLPFDGSPMTTEREEFTVVYSGRLIREKGVDVAIRAIGEARRQGARVRLDIIGDGPERSALEALARREVPESAVSFAGGLEPRLALARMRLADAVVVPSVWSEPAGYVVIEAMALGIPVIASESGGIPELASGAALLVPRSDTTALARAMMKLALDPKLARALVEQGRAVVNSAESAAARYLSLYNRALGARR